MSRYGSEEEALYVAVSKLHLAVDLIHDRLAEQDLGGDDIGDALAQSENALAWIIRRAGKAPAEAATVEEMVEIQIPCRHCGQPPEVHGDERDGDITCDNYRPVSYRRRGA